MQRRSRDIDGGANAFSLSPLTSAPKGTRSSLRSNRRRAKASSLATESSKQRGGRGPGPLCAETPAQRPSAGPRARRGRRNRQRSKATVQPCVLRRPPGVFLQEDSVDPEASRGQPLERQNAVTAEFVSSFGQKEKDAPRQISLASALGFLGGGDATAVPALLCSQSFSRPRDRGWLFEASQFPIPGGSSSECKKVEVAAVGCDATTESACEAQGGKKAPGRRRPVDRGTTRPFDRHVGRVEELTLGRVGAPPLLFSQLS